MRGSALLLATTLALAAAVSAAGCERAGELREATGGEDDRARAALAAAARRAGATRIATTSAETSASPYDIPAIGLRGAERPLRAARLEKGRIVFPQGKVTAAVGCMAGAPLAVPRGDLKKLVREIESAPMKRGDWDAKHSTLDAYLYLDIDTGNGRRTVIDLRFGSGDGVLLANYEGELGEAAYYQTHDRDLAKRLRDAVGYGQVDRNVLRRAESVTLLTPRVPLMRHTLTEQEATFVNNALLRAQPESRNSHVRLCYDCTFEFVLPDGSKQVVTYETGRARAGMGTATYQVDPVVDRLALLALVKARVELDMKDTELDGHFRP